MRGKWAAGIIPRNFAWIIKGHLAVSERPGGSAPVHRRVRRQEEILWLRGQGFTKIVSLLPSPHNLYAYEELGVAHEHIPMAIHDDPLPTLTELYPALLRWLYGGERVLIHQDQLDERLAGVLGGFLYWSGLVPELPLAISAIENLLRRQLGATGRTVATLAIEIPSPTEEDRRRPERPSEAVLVAIAEGRLGPVVDIPRPVAVDEPDEAGRTPAEPEPMPPETPVETAAGRVAAQKPGRSVRRMTPATSGGARRAKQPPKKTAKRVGEKASASTKSATKPAARRRAPQPRVGRATKAAAKSRGNGAAAARRSAAATRSRSATGGGSATRRSTPRAASRTHGASATKGASARRTATTRRKAAGTA